MFKVLRIIAIILLSFQYVNGQVTFTAVTPQTSTTIGLYKKFEVGIALNKTDFINQFDPAEIEVYAIFTHPATGYSKRIDGFWFQDYNRNESSPDPTTTADPCIYNFVGVADPNFLTSKATPLPWRIRFTPDRLGAWTYRLYIRYLGGTVVVHTTTFTLTATTSTEKGYVGVGANKRNFVYKNTSGQSTEESFISLGVSGVEKGSIVYNRAGFNSIRDFINKLSTSGGNTIRIWMGPESYGIEWNEDGIGKYLTRQKRAFDLDELFRVAESSGVKIDLVLESAHIYSPDPDGAQGGYVYWTNNPYKAYAGSSTSYNLFTNATALAYFKRRIRYIVARWGYSTSLLCYELFNEADLVDKDASEGYWDAFNYRKMISWHNSIISYAKTLDDKHMYSTSTALHINGTEAKDVDTVSFARQPLLDYFQDHYYCNDMNVSYQLSTISQRSIQLNDKPYVTGEYGSDESLCKTNAGSFTDESVHSDNDFHNSLWAGLFTGPAGPPLYWHSWSIFNNCWGGSYQNFKPVSLFISDEADFFTRKLTYLANVPTGVKGTKDNPTHTFGNNSMPCWGFADCPYDDSPSFVSKGITTSNNAAIDVFASQDQAGEIRGWVHNRSNYWFNLPHDSYGGGGFCDDPRPESSSNVPTLTQQTMTFSTIECDGLYKVEFFSTYPQYDINGDAVKENGGIITSFTQTNKEAACGALTITLPTMSPLSISGGPYAPDYGFKITEVTGYWRHDFIANQLSSYYSRVSIDPNNKVFYSDINGDIKSVKYNPSTELYESANVSNMTLASTKVAGPLCVNEGSQVYYKGQDSRLQSYYYDAGTSTWNHIWLTDWASTAENIGGNYIATAPQHVYYQGTDNKMHCYFWNSSWTHSVLPHGGDVTTYVNGPIVADQLSTNVFYKGADGRLQGFYWNGTIWSHFWLTNWANTSQNVAGDIVMSGSEIYYAGTDGFLHKYYYSGSTWTHAWVLNQDNVQISIPAYTRISCSNNANDIFFAGADNQIVHLYAKAGNKYWKDGVICSYDILPSYKSNGQISTDYNGATYYVGLNDGKLHAYVYDRGCTPRSTLNRAQGQNALGVQLINTSIALDEKGSDDSKIDIYPNPFNDYLNINSYNYEGTEAQILDVAGKVLVRSMLKGVENKVSTSFLSPGIYIVVIIQNGKALHREKFVKM